MLETRRRYFKCTICKKNQTRTYIQRFTCYDHSKGKPKSVLLCRFCVRDYKDDKCMVCSETKTNMKTFTCYNYSKGKTKLVLLCRSCVRDHREEEE